MRSILFRQYKEKKFLMENNQENNYFQVTGKERERKKMKY